MTENSKMPNTDALINDKLFRMQLCNIRKQKRLTQKQVADMSGLSTSCISNIESGEDTSPTMRSIIKYATALGIEIYIKQKEDS